MKFFLWTNLLCCLLTTAAAETSQLWGEAGELWDPETSVLKDFTNVGYLSGQVPIPDWPNTVNVLDFGAVPNDNGDDSQAFIDAIAACPERAAVFVPAGKYVIQQQIRVQRDYVVLRGEDIYNTVLYFPQYLGEIYPAVYYDESYGYKGGFFQVSGGTHRSIENLTFEFRPQTKMGFWEFRGANAIKYNDMVVDSWIRNIHFRNVDFGLEFGGAERISVINLYFDHYINRPSLVNSAQYTRTVAYLGIGMGRLYYSLIHNVEFMGEMFHDFDVINVPANSVVSRAKGPSIAFENHSRGARYNLFTDSHCGKGSAAHGLADDVYNQTYWGIERDDRDWPSHPDGDFTKALNSGHVFVGYAVDYPDTFTDTFYYENIDPVQLEPRNIYLAQMEYFGKPLPQGPPPAAPLAPELTGDVRLLNPTDDVTPGKDPEATSLNFDAYLKFDLSELQDLDTIERVRLQIATRTRTSATFTLTVSSVVDDSWTQDTLTSTTKPSIGTSLDSTLVHDSITNKWWELDVTDYVKQEWNGDKIVSLYLGSDRPGTFLGSLSSNENGNAPVLVIERVSDPVPGAPTAPTGMYTLSENGHILLDWEDNTETDFAYYNVYRYPAPNADHPIAQGLTISEFTDISAKSDRGLSEMPSDTHYFYTITAVDTHGYESVRSIEFVGNTLDSANSPPAFGSSEYNLANTKVNGQFVDTIADLATDWESNTLYYFKISGPEWVNVAYDGTISGTPTAAGSYQIKVQVNAIGGRDEAIFNIYVGSDQDTTAPTIATTSTPTSTPTSSPTHSPTETPTQSPPVTTPATPTTPTTTAPPPLCPLGCMGNPNKAAVCHRSGNKKFISLCVPIDALPAHLSNHGDSCGCCAGDRKSWCL